MTIVDGRIIGKRLWWEPGDVGTRHRKTPPRAFVWHWTGGSRGADGVCETLRARKSRKTGKPSPLSIHYIIELDGRIVQCCDPTTTIASHAGDANAWTIGCEIVGGPKADFAPSQYAAIGELADAQTLPRRVFRAGVDDVRAFSGHLEHRDLSPRKIDAGGRVGAFLRQRWGCP